jgi:ubiquinone/menaquinone biosynthesis C-methylase UbiE
MQNAHERFLHIQLHRQILGEFGQVLDRHSTILDFGCGGGETVLELRSRGFDAYGVDIKLDAGENAFLRLISTDLGYRIPFDDQTFDFVYSDQVFEHVQDHDVALAEIWRVLKPGGASLHLFPPKYRPLEAHTFVPLAGVLQSRAWLSLWAFLGVRNTFQVGLPFTVVADRNYTYLHNNTRYLAKRDIRRLVSHRFANVTFAEGHFIKHSYGRARHLYPLVGAFPRLAALFSCVHQRVVFFKKHSY